MSEEAAVPETTEIERVAALAAALAAAQGEFMPIEKNQTAIIKPKDTGKQSFSFRYADLEAIISATRPALSKNGIAVVQTLHSNGEATFLTTRLIHKSGGSISSNLRLPMGVDKEDPKKTGAMIAFLRRYEYSAMLCVAADDDLDADADDGWGGGNDEGRPADRRPEPEPARSSDNKAVTSAQVNWIKSKLKALRVEPEVTMAMWKRYGCTSPDSVPADKFNDLKAELLRLESEA